MTSFFMPMSMGLWSNVRMGYTVEFIPEFSPTPLTIQKSKHKFLGLFIILSL